MDTKSESELCPMVLSGHASGDQTGHPSGRTGGGWALWASAFVLLGMLVLRLADGPAPGERIALGDMTAAAGEYHLMTTDNGNEELLYVVDNREEVVFVYGVDSRRRLVLLERQSLPTMFAVMRARAR